MCKGGDSVARKNWTREETILAMDLYTRVPFSKIGKNNQEIINLASIINRTPDAVVLIKCLILLIMIQNCRQEMCQDYRTPANWTRLYMMSLQIILGNYLL